MLRTRLVFVVQKDTGIDLEKYMNLQRVWFALAEKTEEAVAPNEYETIVWSLSFTDTANEARCIKATVELCKTGGCSTVAGALLAQEHHETSLQATQTLQVIGYGYTLIITSEGYIFGNSYQRRSVDEASTRIRTCLRP